MSQWHRIERFAYLLVVVFVLPFAVLCPFAILPFLVCQELLGTPRRHCESGETGRFQVTDSA